MGLTSFATPTQEERIRPDLREYWPFWNLGNLEYFQTKQVVGNAALVPWYHTEEMAERHELQSLVEASPRFVPAGRYTKLMLFQNSHRNDPEDKPVWETVMSDTPDEFNDHEDVILNAEGRVLVHGLGMGCVLHCLVHNPCVTHIDVVDPNPDVMALVLPYYGDLEEARNKITFHLDSCVDVKWPRGTRWNYVWHDIWSTISPLNLRQDDDPEHGISYERLHRMFGNRCDRQASWGFTQARWMRRVEDFEEEYAAKFVVIWDRADFDTRMELLADIATPHGFDGEAWLAFLKHPENTNGHQMLKQMEDCARNDDLDTTGARVMLGDKLIRYARNTVKL